MGGRAIVAHLGSGASLCAMNAGRSVATTMGFSALDGLVMSSRSGSLDPGVVIYLIRERKMSAEAMSELLYERSGLLGVSQTSGDMETLLASADPRAAEAIDFFVNRIGRSIGSLAAAMGGLDTLVFTAGIGENAPRIRQRICQAAAWLGVGADPARNERGEMNIGSPGSGVDMPMIPAIHRCGRRFGVARNGRNSAAKPRLMLLESPAARAWSDEAARCAEVVLEHTSY